MPSDALVDVIFLNIRKALVQPHPLSVQTRRWTQKGILTHPKPQSSQASSVSSWDRVMGHSLGSEGPQQLDVSAYVPTPTLLLSLPRLDRSKEVPEGHWRPTRGTSSDPVS
jgi:hypothetical protein